MANGADLTSTTFDAFLKTRFADGFDDMIIDGYKDPALKAIEKNYEGGGDGYKIPVLTDGSARVSASFANALATDENQPGYAFTLTYTNLYSLASFAGPLMEAAYAKGPEAFSSLVDLEMGRATKGLGHALATQLHRDGTGWIGQIASTDDTTLGTGVVTLANKSDAVIYTKGMILVASQTAGGTIRTGTAKITGVSVANGTITFSTTPNSLITSLTGGDYLYVQGNAANGSTDQVIEGFQSWVVPGAASTSTVVSLTNAFFGVTRSSNQGFLAGQFYANDAASGGPADPMPEALANACSDIQAVIGAEDLVDLILCHPTDYRKLAATASSRLVRMTADQPKAKFSTSGLGLQTDYGVIPIEQSRYVVPGYGEIWSTSTWEMVSTSKPDFKQPDGLTVRWNGSSDSFVSWLGYRNVQTGCKAPGYNGLVRF